MKFEKEFDVIIYLKTIYKVIMQAAQVPFKKRYTLQ